MDKLTIVERQALAYQAMVKALRRKMHRWSTSYHNPAQMFEDVETVLALCDIPEITAHLMDGE